MYSHFKKLKNRSLFGFLRFNKKATAYMDLISDIMMFGLVILILFIGIIVAGMYKDKITRDLVSGEISRVDVDYNSLNVLRQKTDAGITVSEVVRNYCKTGDNKEVLNGIFETYFYKVMPDEHRYKIEIDKSSCGGRSFEQILDKGEIKRKIISGPGKDQSALNPLNYGVFKSPCAKPHQAQVVLPNYDGSVILIDVYDFGCES